MGIYRKGGIWLIDYYFQGQRIRESAGPSKTLAKEALAKRKVEILEGKFFPERQKAAPLTFSQAAQMYWELYAKNKRGVQNPKSARYAASYLRAVTKPFGNKRLEAISATDILAYLSKVREKNSPATYNRHLVIIKSVFNRVIEWGKFPGPNPAAAVKKLQENNKRLRFLSKEEIASLLAACHERLYPVVACAIMTGMRRGEILQLSWENVDLGRGFVYVIESKSGKPREIPIAPQLKKVLASLGSQSQGPVFTIGDTMLKRYFAQALKQTGIKEFRFHDLRHTFASHFIMETGDLPTLQKILGHASPQMTQRYAHLANSHLSTNMAHFSSGMDTCWTPQALPASEAGDQLDRNSLENKQFRSNGPIV